MFKWKLKRTVVRDYKWDDETQKFDIVETRPMVGSWKWIDDPLEPEVEISIARALYLFVMGLALSAVIGGFITAYSLQWVVVPLVLVVIGCVIACGKPEDVDI